MPAEYQDPVGDEREHEDDHTKSFTLEYVLRNRSAKSRIVSSVRATPWWVVSIALHLAATLILGKVVVSYRPPEPEDLVMVVNVQPEEIKPLDLEKIQQIFKQIDKVKSEEIIQSPVLVQATLAETPEMDLKEVPIDAVSENIGDGSEETDFTDVGDGSGPADIGEMPEVPVLGIGQGSFNPRGFGSMSGVLENLAVRLNTHSKKAHGNVLLVWLIDASVSMKDDQEAIRRHLSVMDRKFREKEGSGNLTQALVYFGDRPQLWLKPTEDVEQVMRAFEHIEPNEPGTPENVMSAVIYCAKTFKQAGKNKRILVLVDDDSSDDTHLLENALSELRKSNMTLFVINRQCPFQSEWLRENFEFVDKDGEVWKGSGRVHRGPETARPEIVDMGYGGLSHWSRGEIMSGFGIYDQSRLAFYTGGAYYILDADPEKEKENLAMYDWDLMERYRPDLAARGEYDKRLGSNPVKRGMDLVTAKWAAGQFPATSMTPESLGVNLKMAEEKLAQADELIAVMRDKVMVPTHRLERMDKDRRWPANADLLYAFLHLAKYRLRQYSLALRDFLKDNPSIPKDHRVQGSAGLKPILSKLEAADRAECISAMRQLADRHPRTPWGRVAAVFDPDSTHDLYGFKFDHSYYFQGFWAHIEFANGQKLDAYVADRRNGQVSLRSSKGDRTVPEKSIRSMTPFNPSGGGGSGGRPADPRI